jgi:predicted metal-dependent enzyme (double-stranded beta helix superfamily)
MKKIETVGNSSALFTVKSGYEDFFSQIMTLVKTNSVDEILGTKLRWLALDFPRHYELNEFGIVSDSDTFYERTFIGKDEESGWEAIMMTWREGVQTEIHGHPQFAAYNLLYGSILLEIFEVVDEKRGRVKLQKRFEVDARTGFFAIGESNLMTNHIHRITGLSDIAYSLHIYSDDARKGLVYKQLKENSIKEKIRKQVNKIFSIKK